MTPLLGFTPDLPPETPGALMDCDNLIPSELGMKAAPSLQDPVIDALPAAAIGGVLAQYLDGTRRLIIGTAAALYEQTGTGFTDQSRVGGYTAGVDDRWRFAQFGNATVATNGTDELQESILTGAFADVPDTPPVTKVIEATQGFVFAFNNNSATYGDEPDGWWCSAIYNQDVWTPSIAAQSAKGRLVDAPGPIVGAKALGSDIVAYKERSMFLGTYQGPPVVWGWRQVPGEIGAINHECIVSIGTAHIFIGPDNFYIYDGTRPQPIGDVVRKWFFADLSPTYSYRIIGSHDIANGLVYWYYPSTAGDGTIDSAIVYSYRLNRWGLVSRSIECAVNYLAGSITYDNIGTTYATYDDLPATPYDSPIWIASKSILAIVDTSHKVMTVSGAGEDSSLTTGDIGDDWQYSTLSSVRLRSTSKPLTGSLQTYYKTVLDDPVAVGVVSDLIEGKFDLLISARWHRLKIDMTGSVELSALDPVMTPDGAY